EKVGSNRVDHPEPEHPDELVASRLGNVANARRFLEHLLRLLDDALAHRRDRHFRLGAFKELDTELFLELLNRDRQRRLADEATLRSTAEVSLLCDGNDVAQLGQSHRRRLRKFAKPSPTSLCFSASSTVGCAGVDATVAAGVR